MADLLKPEDILELAGTKTPSGKVYKSATPVEMDIMLGDDADESHGITNGEKFAKISKEELEVRRGKVQKLVMRGVHKAEIAEYLGIHLKTVYADMAALKKQIRKNVMQMDMPLFVGETMSFYDEVKQISLRMATDPNEKDKKIKMAALREAVNAEDSKHRFLALSGMYKAIQPDKVYQGISQGDELSMSDVLTSIEQKLAHIGTDDITEAIANSVEGNQDD